MKLKNNTNTALWVDYHSNVKALSISIASENPDNIDKNGQFINSEVYPITQLSDLYMLKYIVQNAIDTIKAVQDSENAITHTETHEI